jgi:hypothetical protein
MKLRGVKYRRRGAGNSSFDSKGLLLYSDSVRLGGNFMASFEMILSIIHTYTDYNNTVLLKQFFILRAEFHLVIRLTACFHGLLTDMKADLEINI